MRFLLFAIALAFLAVLLSGCAVQESLFSINVSGTDGNPLAKTRVSLMPANENQITTVLSTDSKGNAFALLPAGKYSMTVARPGFKTVVKLVEIPQASMLEVVLQEA